MRPRLERVPHEEVTLLTALPGPPNELGQRRITYSPGVAHQAQVTPLTAEQAVRAGLTATVSRLRVGLPGGVRVAPGDRLRLRGADWKVVNSSEYASYTRVIVEGVT